MGVVAVTVHQLVVGPPRHGVALLAAQLAALIDAPTLVLDRPAGRDDVGLLVGEVAGGDAVHAHVTDALFGASPEEAAQVLGAVAARTRLGVTLHDLPQPSDGIPAARRARAYADIARVASWVVVSSEHERRLLVDVLPGTQCPPVHVVPLPLAPVARVARVAPDLVPGPGPEVGVLGWVYPGKGHAQVLEAMAGLPADVGLVALGDVQPRHVGLAEELARQAATAGRGFRRTGWLPDHQLVAVLQQVAVPVVALQHVSASGSWGSWLSAGRRPVVLPSPYVDEVLGRNPGVALVTDDLPDAIAAALADPGSTWLAPGTQLSPSPAEVAAAHRTIWEQQ